jgi:hypothetical protein
LHAVAEAAWSARKQVRDLKPADPTWLAYAIYAQPNARVVFA